MEICSSFSKGSPLSVHTTVGMGLPDISHDKDVLPCSSTRVFSGSFRMTGASRNKKKTKPIMKKLIISALVYNVDGQQLDNEISYVSLSFQILNRIRLTQI